METKHTPLPWEALKGGPIVHQRESDGYVYVADTDVCTNVYHPSRDLIKANAEFIVKACNCHDDLLEACKRTKHFLEVCHRASVGRNQRIKILEAAIKKAGPQ